MNVELSQMGFVPLLKRPRKLSHLFYLCEDTRRWLSVNQEAGVHQTLNLQHVDLGHSSLQNCEK